jgi:hypothetical protein
VYVFTKPGNLWSSENQAARLTATDGAEFDSLGSQVAIAGNTVAAGSPVAMVGANAGQGAVYLFGSGRP